METFDLKEEYKTLPNETLRKYYKKLTKRQHRLAAITFAFLVPAMLVYGMLGWVNFFTPSGMDSASSIQAQMPSLTMWRSPPAELCSWRIP